MAIPTKIAFAFAGQGAQFPQMGKDLYESSPAARALFADADRILGRAITELCFNASAEELTACANCQPAIFTMSLACLAALQEKLPGVVPVACAGLSLGELSALVAAGSCDFAQALRLVQARGSLMDEACRQTPGGMVAILGETPETVQEYCQKYDIDIANLNCPGQIIVSGSVESIGQLYKELQEKFIKCSCLKVAGAYHSRLMSSASQAFGSELEKCPIQRPQKLFVQNFTGRPSQEPDDIKKNLTCQISGTVRCEDCLRKLMAEADCIIELGPGSVLSGLLKRIDRSYPAYNVSSVATLEKVLAAFA